AGSGHDLSAAAVRLRASKERARTVYGYRDGTAFSAVAPRERPAWLTVRAAEQLERAYLVSNGSRAGASLLRFGCSLRLAARFARPRSCLRASASLSGAWASNSGSMGTF